MGARCRSHSAILGLAIVVVCLVCQVLSAAVSVSTVARSTLSPYNQPILDLDGRIYRLSISPDEKLGAVVLGPPNYLPEQFEPRKLLIVDLSSNEVIAEREFELGLLDCAIFDDRVYVVPMPASRVVELDLKELKSQRRIRFGQSIREVIACGNSHFVLASTNRLALYKRGQTTPITEVDYNIPIRNDRGPFFQTPVEYYDGMVRMNGAWVDLETEKLVALNSRLAFFEFKQGSSADGKWTWDVQQSDKRTFEPSRSWRIDSRPSGPVKSWRFPCVFNLRAFFGRVDSIQPEIEILDIHNGRRIWSKKLGDAKCLPNIRAGTQVEWSMELGTKHAYVGLERSIFKVPLPIQQLPKPQPSFPIRQPVISVKHGERATFSVAMKPTQSKLKVPQKYVLKTLNPGIDLDRNSGTVVVDTNLVWDSLGQIVKKYPKEFTPQLIGRYRQAYLDLTGEPTKEVPMLIEVPVSAKVGDSFLRAAYCLLLMMPEEVVASQYEKVDTAKSTRAVARVKQDVESRLSSELKEAERKQESLLKKLDETWKSTAKRVTENEANVKEIAAKFEAIQKEAEADASNLDALEQLQLELEAKSKTMEGDFDQLQSELQNLRTEAEDLRANSLLTRLIGLGSAAAIFFAGIICYMVVFGRKMQI